MSKLVKHYSFLTSISKTIDIYFDEILINSNFSFLHNACLFKFKLRKKIKNSYFGFNSFNRLLNSPLQAGL